jgi:hypothetical protein
MDLSDPLPDDVDALRARAGIPSHTTGSRAFPVLFWAVDGAAKLALQRDPELHRPVHFLMSPDTGSGRHLKKISVAKS